jgi:hypothetical protein
MRDEIAPATQKVVRRRVRPAGIALATAVGIIAMGGHTRDAIAQPGCTATLAIYCGSKAICTTSAGNNCITCKGE